MSKLSRLTLCLLSIVMVSIPLFDILSNIMDLNRINVISIVILLIILISLLVCSALWLYIEWRDFSEEEQLHQERLKYTSPDLLGNQTKVCLGLHNSSSLYKITHYGTLGRVWQYLRKGYKQDEKLPFGLVAQLVRATDS